MVSIVMPAYNCEQYIRRSIDSLLSQTYRHINILVADDASTDKTREILDSYTDERIQRYHNDENLGYLLTCNKLMRLCRGDYITFQDADDWSEARRIEVLVGILDADPGLYAVGSSVTKVDRYSNRVGVREFPSNYDEALGTITSRGKAACVGSVMFRRELVETVGIYREYFSRKCFEDVDWLYRLMERYRFENIDEPLYNYRNNPSSVTSDFSDDKIAMREVVHILGEQRAREGVDMLEKKQDAELTLLKEQFISETLDRDPLHFCKVRINRALHNNDFKDFSDAIADMLSSRTWYPPAYAVLMVSMVKYVLGISRYQKIRDVLLMRTSAGA